MNQRQYGTAKCNRKWLNPFYIPGAGTAMATAKQARTIRARMMGRASGCQMNNRWWPTGCCWLYSQQGTFLHVSPMCLGYVGNVCLDHGAHRWQANEYPHHFVWSLTDGAIYHAFWWLSTELWYLYWRYHSLVPSHLYNAKTLSFFSKIISSINGSQTQFAHCYRQTHLATKLDEHDLSLNTLNQKKEVHPKLEDPHSGFSVRTSMHSLQRDMNYQHYIWYMYFSKNKCYLVNFCCIHSLLVSWMKVEPIWFYCVI